MRTVAVAGEVAVRASAEQVAIPVAADPGEWGAFRVVDVTDPHRNFTAAEWEKLGTMRSVVLRMRDGNGSGGRGGRGGNESRSPTNSTNRTTSGVSAAETSNNYGNAEASVVSEITERGSQNGRSFGRGAYNNNN